MVWQLDVEIHGRPELSVGGVGLRLTLRAQARNRDQGKAGDSIPNPQRPSPVGRGWTRQLTGAFAAGAGPVRGHSKPKAVEEAYLHGQSRSAQQLSRTKEVTPHPGFAVPLPTG